MTKKANASLWPIGIPEVIEYDFIRSFVFIAVRCRRLASKRVADASGIRPACVLAALALVGMHSSVCNQFERLDAPWRWLEQWPVDVLLRRLLV